MTTPWYKTLPDPEPVFVVMRAIEAQATALAQEARHLAGPGDRMAVGPGAFEPQLHAEALWAFLRHLRKGATPEDALTLAEADLVKVVKHHNSLRPNDFAWQRWEGAGASYLPALVQRIRRVAP